MTCGALFICHWILRGVQPQKVIQGFYPWPSAGRKGATRIGNEIHPFGEKVNLLRERTKSGRLIPWRESPGISSENGKEETALKKTHLIMLILIASFFIGISVLSHSTGSTAAEEKAQKASGTKAQYVGREICEGCHPDYAEAFHLTLHFKSSGTGPDAANQCEACHGPGSEHVNAGGGKTGIVNLSSLHGYKASAVCARCHESKPGQFSWRFSRHATSDVSCNDCHLTHGKSKQDISARQLRDGGQPRVCFTCHANVKAEMNWPSHHPIAEGRLMCADCHNVHGSELSAFKNAPSARELCLTCHPQYRGPFAREHQPVSEGCTECHKPHGALEDNLLATSEPYLCLRCHPMVHNPHVPAATLDATAVQNDVLFFSRCSVCHPNVHGSELAPTLTR